MDGVPHPAEARLSDRSSATPDEERIAFRNDPRPCPLRRNGTSAPGDRGRKSGPFFPWRPLVYIHQAIRHMATLRTFRESRGSITSPRAITPHGAIV